MESIEKMVGNNNGSFPDGGNIFIEPEKKRLVRRKAEHCEEKVSL